MPETHELLTDDAIIAMHDALKPPTKLARDDDMVEPWRTHAFAFARAAYAKGLTAARESDAPELPWATVLKVSRAIIADESTNAKHWQRVGFPDHVIRAAVEAGAKAQRALGVPRESDAAARIAAQREAASRAWDAAIGFRCHKSQSDIIAIWQAERDRYLDREHPLPARECVRCALCDQSGADLSTGVHATRDECIEALGAALKSFAAGVGR